jgi:RHS repeat-associated protein
LASIKKYEDDVLQSESRPVLDGFLPLQVRGGSNGVISEYVWGLNLGGGIGGLLDLKQAGQNYSYLYDGKGNVAALVDSGQAIVAAYTYDAFGNLMSEAGSLSQPFKFSTKPYDDDTGLSYFGYRFYSPVLGRWMTQDPIGYAGGLNLYEYVGNNPVSWIDPKGLTLVVQGNLSEYWQAIGYMNRDSGMSAIIKELTLSSTTYTVVFNNVNDDSFNPAANQIHWDPHSALRCPMVGGTQSPALGLGHEMAHAASPWYWDVLDAIDRTFGLIDWGVYDSMEEWRVIRGPEADAAHTLGEGERWSHRGGVFWVPTPISR